MPKPAASHVTTANVAHALNQWLKPAPSTRFILIARMPPSWLITKFALIPPRSK
jgi:hypothetical protein